MGLEVQLHVAMSKSLNFPKALSSHLTNASAYLSEYGKDEMMCLPSWHSARCPANDTRAK